MKHSAIFPYLSILQPLLGYAKWDNFINNVVVKAKKACKHAGEEIQNHFPDVGKIVSIGYGVEKQIDDILLTRYACYFGEDVKKVQKRIENEDKKVLKKSNPES